MASKVGRERQVTGRKTTDGTKTVGHEGVDVFGPELVPLMALTSPVVEIDLPCGAVVRVPNEDHSLRAWHSSGGRPDC